MCLFIQPSLLEPRTYSSEFSEGEECASSQCVSGLHCHSLGQISNPGEKGAKISGYKARATAEDPFGCFLKRPGRFPSVKQTSPF